MKEDVADFIKEVKDLIGREQFTLTNQETLEAFEELKLYLDSELRDLREGLLDIANRHIAILKDRLEILQAKIYP